MWEGWLSTSSNMGRPPLLQDSWKRQTIISSCTNSSVGKVNSYRWVKGATETYPSYAHTPVVKLVLCSAEETLTESKQKKPQSAVERLICSHSQETMFEIQKLCTIKTLPDIPTAAMDGSSSQMCMRQGGCWQWYVSSGTWPSSQGSTAGWVVCGSK